MPTYTYLKWRDTAHEGVWCKIVGCKRRKYKRKKLSKYYSQAIQLLVPPLTQVIWSKLCT